MTTASAPGKVILCGEHAVVYGQPAIALPLADIRATATVADGTPGGGVSFDLPDVGEHWRLSAEQQHPLATLVRLTLERLTLAALPDLQIVLRSMIPIASGMGSGAALGAALVKALTTHLGTPLTPDEVSRIVYESERFFHGTPSGIDNTVVSYEQAIWFMRRQPHGESPVAPLIEPLVVGHPFALVVGDTGVHAPTQIMVDGLRARWQREPERFEALFAQIGQLVGEMRAILATGDTLALGTALDHNQVLLRELGVSSPELEQLIMVARAAGALGAKLSGGGGGGIMLALVDQQRREAVAQALLQAGAVRVAHTAVG